ncbi:MAG: ADP-ribosylglycohydrolase family protein [Acidobacteria bacterium]|nr:ADP-ribosylglycohydrolase family protein [Acidobacteriota bacterium]
MLREEFHRPGGPRGFGGHADIDEIAEAGILRELTEAFPEYGYLGEELGARATARDPERHTWIVDPNDGTADFLRGFRGASVAIALVRDGAPVLGVVYAYCAPDSAGDLIAWARGCGPVTRDGKPVERAWPSRITEDSTVLASTYSDYKIELNARAMYPMRFRGSPSIAYRLALMAVGEADATISLNAPHSWDYAAGHALLMGAGGRLADGVGATMTYGEDGVSDCSGMCAGGADVTIADLLARNWRGVTRGLRDRTTPFLTPERGRALRDPGRLSRAQGCMIGQLAGDSLGSLVEFQTPERIATIHPDGVTRLETGGVWGTLAGQPTDASEMALVLARSMIRTGRYDSDQAARAYLAWFRSRPFDMGSTTSGVLAHADRRVAEGQSSGEACRSSANGVSQSNGALMRVSPVGIACEPEQAYEEGGRDSGLTHSHTVCREASALYCAAISQAIRTGDGAQAVYDWTAELAARRFVSQPVAGALSSARHAAPPGYLDRQGWVLTALQNAFYQLLHASGPAEGVIDTVARGGDADTNGATAGALLGAVYGFRRFPAQWVDRVLTVRPLRGLPGVNRPRPTACWPTDAMYLAELLATLGS